MLFSEPVFFVFFVVYFLAHLVVPTHYRIWLIIIGSAIFYGYWNPVYTILPFALTFVGWAGALWIERADEHSRYRLWVTIVVLLLPLVFFKYTNFFMNDVLAPLLGLNLETGNRVYVDLALPLGISFVTFTIISYVVDVHRRDFPLEHSYKWLVAYILYFPQLIAGPILRPSQLLPQLRKNRPFHKRLWLAGFTVFTFGLVKKLVFADQMAAVSEPIYANPAAYDMLALWLAVWGFTLQIFCDFSGYTDMAIGLGLMLGVKLPRNFRQPYTATSPADFWHRWHITLSTWLRDYIYIPLGGSRNATYKTVRNVMITMLLGGLWHGANWTFVIWGGLHGMLISLAHLPHRVTAPFKKLPSVVKVPVTVTIVALLWVYFRAADMSTAHTLLGGLWHAPGMPIAEFANLYLFPLVLLVVFFVLHRIDDSRRIRLMVKRLPLYYLLPLLVFLWILAITISAGSSAQFIYFDF